MLSVKSCVILNTIFNIDILLLVALLGGLRVKGGQSNTHTEALLVGLLIYAVQVSELIVLRHNVNYFCETNRSCY